VAAVERIDDDGVVTLRLNRPDKRNALNGEAFEALRGHVEDLAQAGEAVGCVILTGAGPSFCAGADVQMMSEGASTETWIRRAGTVDLIGQLPQPVIAAVRGHCYAGGLELALAADLIVVSETARIRDLHVRYGGHPAWGLTARLPRRVGVNRAKMMTLLQTAVTGSEAIALGLAEVCLADERLDAETLAMARTIADGDRAAAFRLKHLLGRSDGAGLSEQIAYERAYRSRVRKAGGW
jgi:enoyl-CoA hydratase/carnithine racemase